MAKQVDSDEEGARALSALGLALALDIQEALRPDLRILIMSATLDAKALARLLKNAPVIRSQGRLFPVQTHYTGRATRRMFRLILRHPSRRDCRRMVDDEFEEAEEEPSEPDDIEDLDEDDEFGFYAVVVDEIYADVMMQLVREDNAVVYERRFTPNPSGRTRAR